MVNWVGVIGGISTVGGDAQISLTLIPRNWALIILTNEKNIFESDKIHIIRIIFV